MALTRALEGYRNLDEFGIAPKQYKPDIRVLVQEIEAALRGEE